MAKFRLARNRADVLVAFALFGLVACQDAVMAGDHHQGAFEDLSRQVVASPVLLASPRLAPVPALDVVPFGSDDGSTVLTKQEIARLQPPPPPPPPPAPKLVVPTSPSEWFNPRGQHDGTEGIVSDLAKLAITDNSPLYVNECWGRAWGATTSDHHQSQLKSWACDVSIAGIQVPTPQANEAARRIGSALGEPGWTQGNLVKIINGYRIQILWLVEGHYNHVHIGARKV